MASTLSALVENINISELRGPGDTEITGLSFDARTTKPGDLFFAVEGVACDRHQFIPEMEELGVTAIVHSEPVKTIKPGIAYVRVKNVQGAMSPISAAYYGHPSRKLSIVGITGTNGKSTTSAMIYQLLRLFGEKVGLLSTVYHDVGTGLKRNPLRQSTPEAPVIHDLLKKCVDNGVETMVLEATSHGLSEKNNRVGDVEFDVAVMTNVSHEHLEFHGTMKQYARDKANLFRLIDRSAAKTSFGVVNAEDGYAEEFIKATHKPVYTYAHSGNADFRVESFHLDRKGTDFTVNFRRQRCNVRINLPGRFNVTNSAASMLVVAELLGIEIGRVASVMPKIRSVFGRMANVDRGQPFAVIVDFAHTPDAFEKLLPDMKDSSDGRLIAVFGSAGERDTAKRRAQGEIADKYADIIILADEDPRNENPVSILEEIASGCESHEREKTLFLIPNRRAAIRMAFYLAQRGDTVLLLGKGHETSIMYPGGPERWDESGVAEAALGELGYTETTNDYGRLLV